MGKRKIDKEIFKALIEDYGIKDTNDIKDMLKDLMSGTIQTMLEAEIEHELGYAKNSVSDKSTSNSRNRYSKKTVRSEYGNINLDILRDRNSEFEPQVIPKYQREITGIEGQILSLYTKGMSNRDIEEHLNNLYGIDVSPSMISKITDKIIVSYKWSVNEISIFKFEGSNKEMDWKDIRLERNILLVKYLFWRKNLKKQDDKTTILYHILYFEFTQNSKHSHIIQKISRISNSAFFIGKL